MAEKNTAQPMTFISISAEFQNGFTKINMPVMISKTERIVSTHQPFR